MADVTQSVSIFQQIRLVAGLRWRILRNSLRKKSNLLDLLGLIFAGVIGGVLVIGLCFAFYAGGYAFLSQGHLEWIAFLFWGIFLFWQVFPVFVAGFGANFEFRTLLRFPLSLSAFYIIVLPAMLLIVTLFMLLNVTLERLIGSWLERLLSRRRTRELFLGLFVLSMVSLNFLTPLMQRFGTSARPVFFRLL